MRLSFPAPFSKPRAQRAMPADLEGALLLTGPRGVDLVRRVISAQGGHLKSARLDCVDYQPDDAMTVTYSCRASWHGHRRDELVGLTHRLCGPDARDERAQLLADGEHQIAAWIYPDDPDLPGLGRATIVEKVAHMLAEHKVIAGQPDSGRLELRMVSYRPRQRAVVQVRVDGGQQVFYLKVFTPGSEIPVLERLALMTKANVPVAPVLAVTEDHIVVLGALTGTPLAQQLFSGKSPVTGERIMQLLEILPSDLTKFPRHQAWSDCVETFADTVARWMPAEQTRVFGLAQQIRDGLEGTLEGDQPTHGDFHEGQIFLDSGYITGLLDVESAGPGRRIDDMACLLAHLSVQQISVSLRGLNLAQEADGHGGENLASTISRLTSDFEQYADCTELRLRTAGVALCLATGPQSRQAPDWPAETTAILDQVENLVHAADAK